MTKATPGDRWLRAGPITLGLTIAAVAGAQVGGCGGNDTGTTGTGGSGPSNVSSLKPGADANTAFDATPSPDGKTLYFTAVDPKTHLPGVYQAPSDGSHLAGSTVRAGAPFAAPFGIAISTNGNELYVADSG